MKFHHLSCSFHFFSIPPHHMKNIYNFYISYSERLLFVVYDFSLWFYGMSPSPSRVNVFLPFYPLPSFSISLLLLFIYCILISSFFLSSFFVFFSSSHYSASSSTSLFLSSFFNFPLIFLLLFLILFSSSFLPPLSILLS